MYPADSKRKKIPLLFLIPAALLTAAGIAFRCLELDRFLEYDEIWTFQCYAPLPWHEIFTDLATPNNHCLNSLLIKGLCSVSPGCTAGLIRLPALAAGVLLLLLALCAVWKTTRQPGALLMAAVWLSFQADLIHYSRTARGYSLQCLFVLAFFLLLVRPARSSGRWKTALLLFVCAAGACLSVTSGLIFVGACGASWLLCFGFARWKKKRGPVFPAVSEKGGWKSVVPAGAAFLLFAGLWYGCQYTKLKQGQQFGVELSSPSGFLRFCGDTLRGLHLPLLLILTAAGLFVRKRNPFRFLFAFTLIFCGLTLLSALVTKAGPLRVYLPLCAPLTLSGAAALTMLCRAVRRPRWSFPAGLLVSLVPLAVFPESLEKIELPGSEHIAAEVMKETPKDVAIVYRRGDEIPVLFNCPESAQDMQARLQAPAGLSGLLVVGRKDVLEVMDSHGRNVDVPLRPEYVRADLPPKSGIPLTRFQLEPLTENDDPVSDLLLMDIRSAGWDSFVLRRGPWLRIGMIITTGFRKDERDFSGLYLCEKPSMTIRECLDAEQSSGGRIRFYRFRTGSVTGGRP